MYLFDDDDLRQLICDEEIFSLFDLLDNERQVLITHVVKGYTFKFIGGILHVRPQRVHTVYKRSLKKMRKQVFVILKEYKAMTSTRGSLRKTQ